MVKNCDIFFFGKNSSKSVRSKVSQWRSNATNNQNKMGGREEDVKEGRGGRKERFKKRKEKEGDRERKV